MVFEIHGGPYDSAGPARSMEELALADAGYHVFARNPRGSIGFRSVCQWVQVGGPSEGGPAFATIPRVGLTEEQRVYLELARVCRLATADEAGQPHVVPVCPILVDGRLYVASEDNRKVENARANPKVALAFDDYVEDWTALRGLMVRGTVTRVIDGGPDFPPLVEAFYSKFPQYEPQAGAITEADSVILEIEIRSVTGEI